MLKDYPYFTELWRICQGEDGFAVWILQRFRRLGLTETAARGMMGKTTPKGAKHMTNEERIARTETFLKKQFMESEALRKNPADRDYRLEHSYRVANIAKGIAEAEGFDVTQAVIAGLLHDIAYCEEMQTREDWKNHGRRSAAIARPFLRSLGYDEASVNQICYGIATHVDDEADFEWERTAFSETVGDADNIDRYDAYRIHEGLIYQKYRESSLKEKRETVESTLKRLRELKEIHFGTPTAQRLWTQRLEFNIVFYEKLQAQLENSTSIL